MFLIKIQGLKLDMKREIKSRVKAYKIWLLATFSQAKPPYCYWDPADSFRMMAVDLEKFLVEYFVYEFGMVPAQHFGINTDDYIIKQIKDLPNNLTPTGERGSPFDPLYFVLERASEAYSVPLYFAVEID
jgi:hypothetical protein